ncbi:protein NEOXANTHIN-DEFICIENT 1 isoform X2 [Andrographis paniculata]|uniref:protein NEOXANTHIN-DEFICIENT 1 isoform X2 n=1 Tax=Andrographis paniculata TaxID=175694 RepID=UPI0021E79C93|nr:protein NEOXANTHIN-DEFICIENT 1 isoform X2 [Andrographis paniculata]XP_051122084.1 protein NEOXANTHIN-DEFICIENT 1 isoform X2 [Andrographis paniculata]XP_051122086.1 protein NEOXANTHIN-DEFICIENT 1 isoform X2 [Andrographis paniculata]
MENLHGCSKAGKNRFGALYQLHLVKTETARAFIPKEFKLVEAFGYTLGGFFLANYEDSPAGIFDELVIIAGIVWNPPTSCAWAARVLVNSEKACVHGRKDVGLPSQFANFTKRIAAIPATDKKRSRFCSFLSKIGMRGSEVNVKNSMDIQVKETKDGSRTAMDICSINLPAAAMEAPKNDAKKWIGPSLKLCLPSFSGRTEYNPHLLKYSCKIECRLRVVPPAKVMGPSEADNDKDERNHCISIMLSKPILALKFNRLKMTVEAPSIVAQ